MKRVTFIFMAAIMLLSSCSEDETTNNNISLGDYPLKEYYLERSPSVNPWGAGMDFIHEECTSEDTDLDVYYCSEDSVNTYDILFYIVKVYYTDDNGDTQSEGCPALLLGDNVTACQVGAGVNYFDSLTTITDEMIASLVSEQEVDFEACKNESGKYDRDLLYAAYDLCVIGQSFRSDVLVVPDDKTEEEVQPVYLVKSAEGGYTKFMVKQFKGDTPYEKQTLMYWQVISE